MENLNDSLFYWFNQFAGQSDAWNFGIIFFANYLAYILILTFLIWLWLSKDPKSEKINALLSSILFAIVGRGIIVEVIRFFYHHPRPFVTLTNVAQLFPESGYSFPSGHATFFFGLSTIIYLHNKRLGITFFALSIIMGISRIIAGVHYPLDILGGAILGTIVGFVCHLISRNFFKFRNEGN